MAESDAAGPGTPGGPKARAITREDIDRLLAQAEREWESLTPEERARREAESEKADREAYEAALKAARPTIEALERAAKSAERSAASLVWPKPATYWEEAPEIGPAGPIDQSVFASLMENIEPARPLSAEEIRAAVADGVREAMTEVDRKPGPDSVSPPSPPPAGLFSGGAAWAAGQKALLVGRILRELEGLPTDPPEPPPVPFPKKKGGRPHKRTVKGLDCNQWLAAVFAENHDNRHLSDSELSELSREQAPPGWSASAIRISEVRQAQRKMDAAAVEEEYRSRAADTEEELGMNGVRLSKRKTATGPQRRAKPEDRAEEARDRAHDAAADDFIAAAEAAAAKKRTAQ